MKQLQLFILLLISLNCLDCSKKPNIEEPCGMKVFVRARGFSPSIIYCDSVNMYSQQEADVWINGKRNKIFAKSITVQYIECKERRVKP